MPYTPTTVIAGDPVDAASIDGNIKQFRQEINNELLTDDDFVDATLDTRHIAPPTFDIVSLRQFEWRGESGGLKVITKPTATFAAAEDKAIVNPTALWPDRPQTQAPAVTPENSGISRMIHQDQENSAVYSSTGKPYLPGLALSVRFDRECEVMIRVKFCQNNLPSQSTGTEPQPHTTRANAQNYNLVITKPDGTEVEPNVTLRRNIRVGHNSNLRELYMTYQFRLASIDPTFNELGTYHFGIRGSLRPTPNTQYFPVETRNKFESSISLSGKSDFAVEWWNRE
jgi:hypothetical protein